MAAGTRHGGFVSGLTVTHPPLVEKAGDLGTGHKYRVMIMELMDKTDRNF